MDRSLNDGRQFGPYAQELFEDHLGQMLEGGRLVDRLGSLHTPRVGWGGVICQRGSAATTNPVCCSPQSSPVH